MPEYITTYTGVHFYPAQPDENSLRIEDIAHALALICRGNGHLKTFFSVGQHCIWCAKEALARGYGPRIALAALLHDASECYMSDVPRPFKKSLPEYVRHEEELLKMIYSHFLGSVLTPEEEKAIRQIDDDVLYYDLIELLGEQSSSPAPKLKIPSCREFQPFETVTEEYLSIFNSLKQQLEQ